MGALTHWFHGRLHMGVDPTDCALCQEAWNAGYEAALTDADEEQT